MYYHVWFKLDKHPLIASIILAYFVFVPAMLLSRFWYNLSKALYYSTNKDKEDPAKQFRYENFNNGYEWAGWGSMALGGFVFGISTLNFITDCVNY